MTINHLNWCLGTQASNWDYISLHNQVTVHERLVLVVGLEPCTGCLSIYVVNLSSSFRSPIRKSSKIHSVSYASGKFWHTNCNHQVWFNPGSVSGPATILIMRGKVLAVRHNQLPKMTLFHISVSVKSCLQVLLFGCELISVSKTTIKSVDFNSYEYT